MQWKKPTCKWNRRRRYLITCDSWHLWCFQERIELNRFPESSLFLHGKKASCHLNGNGPLHNLTIQGFEDVRHCGMSAVSPLLMAKFHCIPLLSEVVEHPSYVKLYRFWPIPMSKKTSKITCGWFPRSSNGYPLWSTMAVANPLFIDVFPFKPSNCNGISQPAMFDTGSSYIFPLWLVSSAFRLVEISWTFSLIDMVDRFW